MPCIVVGTRVPVIGISADLGAPFVSTRSAWGLLRSPDGEMPTLYASTLDLSDFSRCQNFLWQACSTFARISRGFPLMEISIPTTSAAYFWSELEDVA
jgi:hypothetical protein